MPVLLRRCLLATLRLGRQRRPLGPGRVRRTGLLSAWGSRGGRASRSHPRGSAVPGNGLGARSRPPPFGMLLIVPLGGDWQARADRGSACLQPFQPGEERPLVGRGSGEQHLRALEQQPRRRGPAHLGQAGGQVRRAGQRRPGRTDGLLRPSASAGPAAPRSAPWRSRVRHRVEDDQVAQPLQQVGGKRRGSCPPSTTRSTISKAAPPDRAASATRSRRAGRVRVAEQRGGAGYLTPASSAPASSWSRMDSESRAEPPPARTTSGSTRVDAMPSWSQDLPGESRIPGGMSRNG
jgi:hypothetical protein